MDYYASSEWKKMRPGHPGEEKSTRWLLEKSGLPAGGRILDLCCGGGYSADLLNSLAYEVTGADRVERKTGDMNCGWRFFLMEDEGKLALPDCFFDGVLCECSFSLFGENTDRMAEEVERVLKPGGVFMLSDVYEKAEGRKLKSRKQWEEYLSEQRFEKVCLEDMTDELHRFAAQYLWQNGKIIPDCAYGADGHIEIDKLGYFHGVWRKRL